MNTHEISLFKAILIASVVLGVIILYFIISIIRQQRHALELHRLAILAEINTLERERTRIAADLHDELGPLLSAIKFKINSVDTTDEDDQYQLDKASTHIDDLITRLREIAADLMPTVLLRKGLVPALHEFVNSIQRDDLDIKLQADELPALPQDKSINVYRILQEVIHNTIKHARASELLIQIKHHDNMLIIQTADNGVGFDYVAKKDQSAGFGLRNLRSRAELMGGRFSAQSVQGKGTQYSYDIPLN